MPELEAHPAAAVWPMMTDDELDALAADIRANGLRQPIVLTPDGLLLDGRNRAEACRRVKVKPATTVHDGDSVAYVLSANAHRRHITKGQRAMAGWLSLDNQETQKVAAERVGVSPGVIGQAAMVAKWAADLVAQVIGGATPLDVAYQEARDRKADADSIEARMARLPPDLAAQVREESLTLDEAVAAAQARAERERADAEARERTHAKAADIVRSAIGFLANPAFADSLAERLPVTGSPLDSDEIAAASSYLDKLRETMP